MKKLFFLTALLFLFALTAAADPAEWKSARFGQSVLPENNKISVDPASKSVTITAGVKEGTTVGGKITNSHDGISYYYTEISPRNNFVLKAKIRVNFFAKEKPDNQEGFGIMARDAVNKDLEFSVFPSNMVLVGGYRGNIQSVARDNVSDISGAGATMEEVFKFGDRPANDGSAVYTMTMKKTNTGYHVSVNNSPEKIYYHPKQLEILDKDKIYVGFFAARVASITVTDIELTTTDAAADPAGENEPVKKAAAAVNVLSLKTASISDYNLKISSNTSGKIIIKLNGSESADIINNSGVFTKTFKIVKGENIFDIQFTPDSDNSGAIKIKHSVTYKTYGTVKDTIYVSPSGKPSSAGTSKDPLDIYSAVQFVQPGQTILLTGGVYKMEKPLIIEKENYGDKGNLKILKGISKPVLDFGKKTPGVSILGSRWKFYGIDITGALSIGLKISGNYNIIESINTYFNGDTGLQISGLTSEKIDSWPSYNLILNCESNDNRDPSENNADGFAAKITCGVGNVFRGCISHNNCDDGWDLYSKLETGPIGAVVIENCISYSNGILSDGTITKGDGNGFKLGGEGLSVRHVLRNSLSYKNKTYGIMNNSDPAVIVENNTSIDNRFSNFVFNMYTNAIPQFMIKNNISFRTIEGTDDLFRISGNDDIKFFDSLKSADNYFIIGKMSVNSEGKKITGADFNSLKIGIIKRSSDGKILPVSFMVLKPNSNIKSGAKPDDYSKITVINDK
jgi:hypothetical protein